MYLGTETDETLATSVVYLGIKIDETLATSVVYLGIEIDETLAISVVYLGIEIDETLSWNDQLKVLSKNLSRTDENFSKLSYYIPTESFTSIHYTLFLS